MAITFVALNYAPSVGGAQHYVGRVAEGLAALGHDVEVLTTDSRRGPSGQDPGLIPVRVERRAGVQIRRHRVPVWARQPLRAFRWANVNAPWAPADAADAAISPCLAGPPAPGMVRSVHRALRTRDVVVGCSAPYGTMVGPPWLRPLVGGASVVSVPLLHAGRDDPHRLVGAALRRGDASVAVTPFERDLQISLGLRGDRVVVLSPGVENGDFGQFSASGARAALGLPERPTVGYVGRLAAYKGVDTLLDAAPALWASHPDVTVLVAGATTGWAGHRKHRAHDVAAGRLIIREDFRSQDLESLLAACDVVVYPSRDESFGMTILEAWASRRPVVACDIDAVREVMSAGAGGELVMPGDHLALARVMGELLDDPSRAESLGAAGRAHVERYCSWSATVAGWDDFLDEVVPMTGRRGVGA